MDLEDRHDSRNSARAGGATKPTTRKGPLGPRPGSRLRPDRRARLPRRRRVEPSRGVHRGLALAVSRCDVRDRGAACLPLAHRRHPLPAAPSRTSGTRSHQPVRPHARVGAVRRSAAADDVRRTAPRRIGLGRRPGPRPRGHQRGLPRRRGHARLRLLHEVVRFRRVDPRAADPRAHHLRVARRRGSQLHRQTLKTPTCLG